MSRNTIRIGYPGNIFEIPAPSTGMNFGNNSDTEVSELDSGGRYVYDKATTFKTFNMSWRTVTPKVQALLDMYNKRYGRKPFYLQDMRGGEGNILPARWAYSYQLAHVFGIQGQPKVTDTFAGTYVTFNGNRYVSDNPPTTVHMLHEGRNHYLMPWGSATGGAGVRHRRFLTSAGTWTAWTTVAPKLTGAPYTVCTALETDTYSFIEIGLDLKASAVLALHHMDLSTTDYRSSETPRRHSEGVGGLKFTNTLDGELTMLRAEKIGLSVDLTEVEDK